VGIPIPAGSWTPKSISGAERLALLLDIGDHVKENDQIPPAVEI